MIYITPRLETSRLILKRGSKEDYLKVYEFDFTKLRDINGEFEYVKQNLDKLTGFDTYADETDDIFDWIVYLKESDIPIANITADRVNKNNNSIELAFNMHPNYWRQGYMKEAVYRVMNFLFSYGFDNVICGYSEGNIKSKNINEKLGFELYKVIENSWQKDNVSITDYKTIMSKERFFTLNQELFCLIDSPERLLEFMSDIKYSWMDKLGVFHDELSEDMYSNYSLMSPEEVIFQKCGICMDQVQLERFWFEKYKYEFEALNVQVFREDSSPGHAFVIYKDNEEWCWFENAWYDMKGIHRFKSKDYCLKFIINKFKEQNNVLNFENLQIESIKNYPYHISYEEMDSINKKTI